MIGWLFFIITLVISGVLWILLGSIPQFFPKMPQYGQEIISFLLLTVFTSSWGKVNNPDFEFKTFFKIIFLLPRRLQLSLRISFSYLVRIKIDDHYLLIRNGKKNEARLKNRFQPVGGVYKMLHPKVVCKKFHLIDDNMPDSPSDDLRKRLTRPFKIFALLEWFHDKEDIEAAPFREFYEELIKPDILPADLFSSSLFNKVDIKKSKVVWSPHNKINEYKIFEIYELNLTSDQEKLIRELKKQGHPDIRFVRRDDIRKYADKDTPWEFGLTDHCPNILE